MKLIRRVILASAIVLSFPAFAEQIPDNVPSPWFTGPLLAPSGRTYTPGHIGYQFYTFYTDNFGFYNRRSRRITTVNTDTWNPQMLIQMGLTKRTEFDIGLPYLIRTKSGVTEHGFGDVSVTFAYQAFLGAPHTWEPDLKIKVSETFPTGRYENLNPGLHGTDSLGAGSYQTSIAGTFQKLWYLGNEHFLKGRLNATYTIPARVRLHGFNSYGGGVDTDGTIKLGNQFSTDLGLEYTITRHWVPAIDLLYIATSKSNFNGNLGTTVLGLPAPISTVSSEEFSIAPAMEYNFNAVFGVIVGVWFTIEGRNQPEFTSGVISLVAGL